MKKKNGIFALIASDPCADLKSNFTGLITIFINHFIAYASDTYKYIMEQLKRSDLSNISRQVFKLCNTNYKKGIDIFKTWLQDLLNDPNINLKF